MEDSKTTISTETKQGRHKSFPFVVTKIKFPALVLKYHKLYFIYSVFLLLFT